MKKIFISYSHKDEEWKDRVVKHLQVFQLEGFCRTWDDRQIKEGTKWEKEITDAIQSAHASILLITTDFLTSDFIRKKETPLILERWKKDKIIVFPVIVKPCSWKAIDWLEQMQVFPKDGIPLAKGEEVEIEENLSHLAEKVSGLLQDKAGAAAADETPGSTPGAGKVKTVLLTGLPKRQIKLLGREKELAELEKKLDRSERVLLVNGLGGIGKTEVCKRFFMLHYSQYQYAGWIDYLSTVKESMVNDFIAKVTGGSERDTLDERFEILKEFLSHLEGNALLIIDNIENPDDPDLDLFKTLPVSVKVMATSRRCIQGFEEFPLEVLPPGSCRELFYQFYKGTPDDGAVNRLVELCGCHTLTVELLARTASKEKLKIGELVNLLEKKGFNLEKVICEPVATFWHDEKGQKLFFHHLQTLFDLSKLNKKEKHVSANLSVLPSVYIPAKDVCTWIGLKTKKEINGLIEKGWLVQDPGFNLYMHPVIREVVRQKTKPGGKTCEKLIDSLKWKLYSEPDENPMEKKGFVIFAEEVFRHIDEKTDALAALANNLSTTYQDLGQLERALEFQLKANEVYEQVLDKNHPWLATSYNNLSLIYKASGQLGRALEFQLKAVEIREQVLDKNHPDLAASYDNLSNIYTASGQLERALKFQLKAVAIREQVLDKNHPDLATSYNNLSIIYRHSDQLDRALEFQLKTLEISEQVLDKNHPSLATSYNNLSLIYKDLGQLERALEFQLKTTGIFEQVLDKNHPSLATSYNNLSMIYQDIGQLERARAYGQKAVSIMESLFPHGHPNIDLFRKNLEDLEK